MLKAKIIFPFKPNVYNFFEFLATKFIQNQYLRPNFNVENLILNSIKFGSFRAFQQHQENFQILIFFMSILFGAH